MSEAILEIQKLSKAYVQGATSIEILRGAELVMEPSDTIAILGQSGSGKSTLLSLLAGLDRADAGDIKVCGQSLQGMSEQELTKFRGQNLGIIFQQFHLMSGLTALENVSLPLELAGKNMASQSAKEALELVGLGHRLDHLPNQLSGGECQRVAIARAFVVKPRLLLADEPSGNLDTDTGKRVMDLLFDAVAKLGMSMVLVTHDEALAKRCHISYRLEQGQLIKQEG